MPSPRIGEILLAQGWIDRDSLARALAEQPHTGLRVCSLLLARGMVGFDHAARALGQQLEVPAVLLRHLEHRDPRLARLLPAAMARGAIALPIGRMGNGALVVCARDPSPALHAAFTRAIGEAIVLAVGPARPLEHLVTLAYLPAATDDFVLDVEIDPGTDGSVEVDFDAAPSDPPAGEPVAAPVDDPADEPFELEITSEPMAPRTTPRRTTARPVEIRAIMPGSAPAPSVTPSRHSLEGTIASFTDVDALDWLLDVVMTYVATRWTAALLFELLDGMAVGRHGHGRQLTDTTIRATSLSLAVPSIIQLAHDRRRLVDDVPPDAGESQATIATLLGAPRHLAAVVLTRGEALVFALVVGEPRADDPDDAAVDLARLAEATSEALERIGGLLDPSG